LDWSWSWAAVGLVAYIGLPVFLHAKLQLELELGFFAE